MELGGEMMFKKFLTGQVIQKVLRGVRDEYKTTIVGFLAAALLAQDITWRLVLVGDTQELGELVGCIFVALLGWFTRDRG
jgi:hypothetical protein